MTSLLRRLEPEVIIHMASALRDDPPSVLFRTNVEGTIALINAIVEARISLTKLILGSSGSVYGYEALNGTPLDETRACAPADMYATSKLASEHVSRVLSKTHNVPTLWARLFNLVGAGQDERHACGKFASQVAGIRRGTRSTTIEVGDLSPMRDFVDVRDAATAVQVLVERGEPGECYNVATGREIRIGSILKMLIDQAQLDEPVEIIQRYVRPNDFPCYSGNKGRLSSLGFEPRYSLAQSLRRLLDYYLNEVPHPKVSS